MPFPHPLAAMQAILHSAEKMSAIYALLPGTRSVDSISGARAISFCDAWKAYHNEGRQPEPQNNLMEASRIQRRDIATFEDYYVYLGLEVETGTGPERPENALGVVRRLRGRPQAC